jgi:hypothetical protein
MNNKPFIITVSERDAMRSYRGSNWQDAVAKRERRFAIATNLEPSHPVMVAIQAAKPVTVRKPVAKREEVVLTAEEKQRNVASHTLGVVDDCYRCIDCEIGSWNAWKELCWRGVDNG